MMVTLPQPNGGFHWVQLGSKQALVCEALTPFASHFFTTRAWHLGERTTDVRVGWNEVVTAAAVGIQQLRRLDQVHGCDVATYARGDAQPVHPPKADIVVTDDHSLLIGVQTADCLPLLVVDRTTRTVAAAHAGWRGLAAGVPKEVVSKMGGRVQDLLVAVGPAIGPCCYEVADDVRASFLGRSLSDNDIDRWFHDEPAALTRNPGMRTRGTQRRSGRWFFDIWACVREQLEVAGVPRDQIFVAELCTASHEDCFCSYRRDGAVAGRMAAVIRSKKLEVGS